MRGWIAALLFVAAGGTALAQAEGGTGGTESVRQALCRVIEGAARENGLSAEFLTRLIWAESNFRSSAVSPVGAQGIAQFMPGTARERGLGDPFDPEQAIPKAAEFLRDLKQQFGNWGLAAAAYNGGPARVAAWLDGRGGLPEETRTYVIRITGRSAEDWAALRSSNDADPAQTPKAGCNEVVANLRIQGGRSLIAEAVFAPWGVQLAGNFSKERALASFARARQAYASIIGDVRPMVIGTRLRSRGTRTFYRIRVPAASRAVATTLCDRLRQVGGGCIVLPS